MIAIRARTDADNARVIEIWRGAVAATHDFLDPSDRDEIEVWVKANLPMLPLTVATDASDRAVGFMLVVAGHMAALFIDPLYRGSGVGAALVRHGLELNPSMTTDVNEQNDQAVGFYEHMGFRRTGRSPLDGQGRPYPLIHMAFAG
jgi:putative acetyltransferase